MMTETLLGLIFVVLIIVFLELKKISKYLHDWFYLNNFSEQLNDRNNRTIESIARK
ncbi:MAG: hypothetical protein WCW87_01970 [Candidatus Paceibacterota bacterium]